MNRLEFGQGACDKTRRYMDSYISNELLVETTHELLANLPAPDDLSFLHSGMCQTCLPHRRPADNRAIWRRHSER